jgi:hypothetical protein
MGRLGKRARQSNTWKLVGGVALIIAVLGIVSAGTYRALNKPAKPDVATLCPASGPTGHVVLLVDKTDPLNFTQKQAFDGLLREVLHKQTPAGYLLSVFVLGEDFTETATPVIELCNPGSAEGKSEFTSNVKRTQRQYEEKFLGPMARQAESLVALQPARQSPIFEMLQLVSINGFRRHDVKGEQRLIVVSDMLHNTTQATMYKGPLNYESFAASDYGRKVALTLPDVTVELHVLMNSPQLQTRRNLAFWEAYFSKAGARVSLVRPMEG